MVFNHFLCVNEFPFLLFFSFLWRRSFSFPIGMCFSFEGRYANHQHRHTDEKKKSGRAPYWFVSPFNNISVLIDTKEEKNKNLHSLCRDKRRQDVRQQAKHLRRLMKTKIGSFGRVVKDRHTAHKV
jgi:hypothetical protein